ncbi:EamA family transporter [Gottfriedia sp. NPDC057991]|uniref:EamA family transporter n=1 Tax=Gottfriedia sp. NPDC057991 TaxID=3346298 RepID=UPI0036DC7A20
MFFLALISSFLNAVNALYAKKITLQMKDNNSFIVTSFLVVTILLGCVMPWYYSFSVTPATIGLLIIVIILDALSNVSFFLALGRIEVSQLAVYTALTPLFTFIPNSILHGFDIHILIPVLLIVLGVYFLNVKGRNMLSPLVEIKKPGNLLGVAAAVSAGLSMVPTQQLLVHQWINAPTLYFFRASGIALIIYLIHRPKIWYPKLNIHLSIRGVLAITQWIALFAALKIANGTLVVALAYTSPIFALFLARIYYKEKITAAKLIACCITILGILFILE